VGRCSKGRAAHEGRRFNDYLTTLVGELFLSINACTVGARPATKDDQEERRGEEAMFTMKRLATLGMIAAGVTLGWSTGANAQASAPDTSQGSVATAQQQADASRQRATELARAGGWAYKTGLVGQAQRDAARHQEEADRAAAEAQSCPPPAPPSLAEAAALARLEELRQASAWAYKTGAVARAEREVQAAQSAGGQVELVATSPAQTAALARLEELRQAGGWAYKTGAVARAEREVQAQATTTQPTSICGGREGQPRVLMTSRM
jgi:hypothetical protein